MQNEAIIESTESTESANLIERVTINGKVAFSRDSKEVIDSLADSIWRALRHEIGSHGHVDHKHMVEGKTVCLEEVELLGMRGKPDACFIENINLTLSFP